MDPKDLQGLFSTNTTSDGRNPAPINRSFNVIQFGNLHPRWPDFLRRTSQKLYFFIKISSIGQVGASP